MDGLAELRSHHAFWQPRREMREALRDIHGDAYGTRDERTHSVLFTVTLRDIDGFAGVDEMPAPTLALANARRLFGLHQRLVGALVGFLTAVDTIGGDPFAQLLPVQCPPEDVRLGFTVVPRTARPPHPARSRRAPGRPHLTEGSLAADRWAR